MSVQLDHMSSAFIPAEAPVCRPSCLIACVHPHEIYRSTNFVNLQFAPTHKVVMKDDNWCQNLFNLLVCIFLIYCKPKFLWKLKQHEIRLKCLHQRSNLMQISRAFNLKVRVMTKKPRLLLRVFLCII